MKAKGRLAKPVVLTGAMRQNELHRTDSVQNLSEALCAMQVVAPGVYVAMHNRCSLSRACARTTTG